MDEKSENQIIFKKTSVLTTKLLLHIILVKDEVFSHLKKDAIYISVNVIF